MFEILGSTLFPDSVQGARSLHASLRDSSTNPIFVAPPTPPPPTPPVTGSQIVVRASFTCTVSYGGSSW